MTNIDKSQIKKLVGDEGIRNIENCMNDYGYTFKKWQYIPGIKYNGKYSIRPWSICIVTDETGQEFGIEIFKVKCPDCHHVAIAYGWNDGDPVYHIDCGYCGESNCASGENLEE